MLLLLVLQLSASSSVTTPQTVLTVKDQPRTQTTLSMMMICALRKAVLACHSRFAFASVRETKRLRGRRQVNKLSPLAC